MNAFADLSRRGLLRDATEGLEAALAGATPLTAYIGFDPTAPSLHVGSLLPVLTLVRLQQSGHTPIALVGGGTGLIGDPSGKSKERPLMSLADVEQNVERLKAQLARFLDFDAGPNAALMINNADWLTRVSLVDFLRDVGKHFTVNYMLAKDSVQRRAANEDGISYTEFSYMLMQAYDFLMLHDRHRCLLQAGGSDQWGNIVAGIELIRRVRGVRAYGFVTPLLTTAAGTKFGKTEAGTVWLDAALTSPYSFYQFWRNAADADVDSYLRFFTMLPDEEIARLAAATAAAPERREAQRVLAAEVTRRVHGEALARRAARVGEVLFGGEIAEEDWAAEDLLEVLTDAPTVRVPRALFGGAGAPLLELVRLACASSKAEARRLVEAGAIYVNNRRLGDAAAAVPLVRAIGGRVILLRKGARSVYLLVVEEGENGPAVP
jgi:tyrosyl-tRNA synthetase